MESMILKTLQKKLSNIAYRVLRLHTYMKTPYSDIRFKGGSLLITVIAFNNKDMLDMQYERLKACLTEPFDYLVADNSSSPQASRDIQAFCLEKGISYVRIPWNPLTNVRASGSHGIALNWCYRNITRVYKPKVFGFLDHDIFPLKETTITPHLDTGFFGVVKTRRGPYWYLWPGFCFFNYERVRGFSFDFFPHHAGRDGSIFLDTGGSNYYSIYRHIGRNAVREAQSRLINRRTNTDFVKGEDSSEVFEIIDTAWLHLRQIAWRAESSHKVAERNEIVESAKQFLV